MDLSQRALQTNRKLFQISELFFELVIFFRYLIVALCLCMLGGGGTCADQHTF